MYYTVCIYAIDFILLNFTFKNNDANLSFVISDFIIITIISVIIIIIFCLVIVSSSSRKLTFSGRKTSVVWIRQYEGRK